MNNIVVIQLHFTDLISRCLPLQSHTYQQYCRNTASLFADTPEIAGAVLKANENMYTFSCCENNKNRLK